MAADRSARTEPPTPKRRREAREKGQVARTPELVGWGSLLISSFLVRVVVQHTARGLDGLIAGIASVGAEPSPATATTAIGAGMRLVVTSVLPLALGLMLFGITLDLAQVASRPSMKRLRPDLRRLNPFRGLQRIVSSRSLWETAKAALRLVVVAAIAWPMIAHLLASASRGGSLSLLVSTSSEAVLELLRNAAAAGLVLAGIDYLVQRRRLLQDLRMTRAEVVEERRQSEGDPHVRSAIRSRQLRMSRNRMIAAVRTADVVLVNPSHVAVALAYRPQRGAPEVVASGAGVVALAIRRQAERHAVPVVEEPPLARLLWKCCQVGELIPFELYEVVAYVLAFVYQLGQRRALGGTHRVPYLPPVPSIPSRPSRRLGRLNSPARVPIRANG
jgi:flagellar biosynthetic protein FlhB